MCVKRQKRSRGKCPSRRALLFSLNISSLFQRNDSFDFKVRSIMHESVERCLELKVSSRDQRESTASTAPIHPHSSRFLRLGRQHDRFIAGWPRLHAPRLLGEEPGAPAAAKSVILCQSSCARLLCFGRRQQQLDLRLLMLRRGTESTSAAVSMMDVRPGLRVLFWEEGKRIATS